MKGSTERRLDEIEEELRELRASLQDEDYPEQHPRLERTVELVYEVDAALTAGQRTFPQPSAE